MDKEKSPLRTISLGWGVQSFTLAAMTAIGELDPVDFVIHADTQHESQLTYEFAERWTIWLNEHGVNVITVKPDRSNPLDNGYGQTSAPFYTLDTNGNKGQGKRQCTTDWKVIPIRRYISSELKRRNLSKTPGIVEQWIGISLDEYQRMRDNDVKYIVNRWPLIERNMTRRDCEKWLQRHDLDIPPKSSCTFCPYHSASEWRRIKSIQADFDEAVVVDNAIRKIHSPFRKFVHPSMEPLIDIDFRTIEEKGQLSLWNDECYGICGV